MPLASGKQTEYAPGITLVGAWAVNRISKGDLSGCDIDAAGGGLGGCQADSGDLGVGEDDARNSLIRGGAALVVDGDPAPRGQCYPRRIQAKTLGGRSGGRRPRSGRRSPSGCHSRDPSPGQA